MPLRFLNGQSSSGDEKYSTDKINEKFLQKNFFLNYAYTFLQKNRQLGK